MAKIAPKKNTGQAKWYEILDLIAGLDAHPTYKLYLVFVLRHTNSKKKYAWESQESLASEIGCSVPTVERAVAWSKKTGIVTHRLIRTGKGKDDQHDEYWLSIDQLKRLQPHKHPSPMMGANDWQHPSSTLRAPITGDGIGLEVKQEKRKDREHQPSADRPLASFSSPESQTYFEQFCRDYPKHRTSDRQIQKARAAWLSLTTTEAQQVCRSLAEIKTSSEWTNELGRFVPAPEKFIAQRRWQPPTFPNEDAIQKVHQYFVNKSGAIEALNELTPVLAGAISQRYSSCLKIVDSDDDTNVEDMAMNLMTQTIDACLTYRRKKKLSPPSLEDIFQDVKSFERWAKLALIE